MQEFLKFNQLGQWVLEKAIRKPAIGSPAAYANSPRVEGAAKPMKYQGGDPRHEWKLREHTHYGPNASSHMSTHASTTTRAGNDRPGYGSGEAMTSGASKLRENTKNSEYRRTHTWDKQGRKVKWHQHSGVEVEHDDKSKNN